MFFCFILLDWRLCWLNCFRTCLEFDFTSVEPLVNDSVLDVFRFSDIVGNFIKYESHMSILMLKCIFPIRFVL